MLRAGLSPASLPGGRAVLSLPVPGGASDEMFMGL